MAPEQPAEADKQAELDALKARIESLRDNIRAWNDPVPADRELLQQLLDKEKQLEDEIAEHHRKAA